MTTTRLRIRLRRAQAAIDADCHLLCTSTVEETLTDLIADLIHWADATEVGFDRCLSMARLHHETETGGAS